MAVLPLSVVIITRNESAHIEAAIQSCLAVSEDIIVVDSGSTDLTVNIAQNMGARVFARSWEGYSVQKNFGNSQARFDYIFSLDADERLTEDIYSELTTLFTGKMDDVYAVNRLNHFAGHPVFHGAWNPDWQYRLFRKSKTCWDENLSVHEQLIVSEDMTVGRLNSRLLHFTTDSEKHYEEKMIRYAEIFREKRMKAGKKANLVKSVTSAGFRFLREYLFQGGILDGVAGFKIARAHYKYTRIKYS